MRQHNPMHPGEWLNETYLIPLEMPAYKVAEALGVAPSTFSRILNGKAPITADMAIRLSRVLGRSPESWLVMQTNWDLWQAAQKNDHENLKRLPALSV